MLVLKSIMTGSPVVLLAVMVVYAWGEGGEIQE